MVREVVKFKIQITARRSATSFTAGGIGSDVTAAMTHMKKLYIASQFFFRVFLQHKISGLVPTGREALAWCPVIWATATERRIQGGGRLGTGGYKEVWYTLVQDGCCTEGERSCVWWCT